MLSKRTLRKFLVHLPEDELCDEKYAVLPFAGAVPDEKHQVAIETEAEMHELDAILANASIP